MLTSEQLRAARAMLRWDQATVAGRAKVSSETVKRLEKMDGPLLATTAATIHALEEAFREAGVEFLTGSDPGVRLRRAIAAQ
ncbi:transcriptional regulator [Methylobacterium sp. E-005]|nr:transcriptional regulator [Methylobacterium sp. E-005]